MERPDISFTNAKLNMTAGLEIRSKGSRITCNPFIPKENEVYDNTDDPINNPNKYTRLVKCGPGTRIEDDQCVVDFGEPLTHTINVCPGGTASNSIALDTFHMLPSTYKVDVTTDNCPPR
jgi:hypothetical protein